jgi:putative NIF3 family GTP cyclohydrolase 1 type 2
MKAKDFREHCAGVAPWVDWEKTVDRFMFGDPETEVRGIAVTWLATDAVLRRAAERGANFVVSHEGAFYPHFAGTESEDRHHEAKRRLLRDLGIVLMRCHDTWDRMPEFGIVDSWADFLGFPSAPRPADSFYRVCDVEGLRVEDAARRVLEKTLPLGGTTVSVIGDPRKRVSRMAVGTGAITRLPAMHALGADLILATDDGFHTTYCGLWSLDLDVPVLVVSHATAELPGMMALADYIRREFPGVDVAYLPCGFPCAVVAA